MLPLTIALAAAVPLANKAQHAVARAESQPLESLRSLTRTNYGSEANRDAARAGLRA